MVVLNGALDALKEAFNEKTRTHALEALAVVAEAVNESQTNEQQLREALVAMSAVDSGFADITVPEGIRRLRERINDEAKESSLLRVLNERQDAVITACKVALVDTVTADHRWHGVEENCPHVRCIALNKIEELRG